MSIETIYFFSLIATVVVGATAIISLIFNIIYIIKLNEQNKISKTFEHFKNSTELVKNLKIGDLVEFKDNKNFEFPNLAFSLNYIAVAYYKGKYDKDLVYPALEAYIIFFYTFFGDNLKELLDKNNIYNKYFNFTKDLIRLIDEILNNKIKDISLSEDAKKDIIALKGKYDREIKKIKKRLRNN